MSDKKQNKTDKLDKIKTDLEIKLVKIELQKLKLKEESLPKKKVPLKKEKVVKKEPKKKGIIAITEPNKKNTSKPKPVKGKNKKSTIKTILSKNTIFAFLLLIVVITAFGYIYHLKNKLESTEKSILEAEERENIDLESNNYFKDIEEELSDDELQDFSTYKDIPDNTLNDKAIAKTKINKSASKVFNNKKSKTSLKEDLQNNSKTLIVDSTVDLNGNKSEDVEVNDKKPIEEETIAEEIILSSDFINVMALQYISERKYILPKKRKRADAFKVRVRINKFKVTTSNDLIAIKLFVKDKFGKTLKTDTKNITFDKNKTVYVTFYLTFKDNLKLDKDYKFSIFADDTIIQTATKRI